MPKITTTTKSILADMLTPVSVYARLRTHFADAIMLESSDYHSASNCWSFICVNELANVVAEDDKVKITYNQDVINEYRLDRIGILSSLQAFTDFFEISEECKSLPGMGIYGYMAYDVVKYFHNIPIQIRLNANNNIPLFRYGFFNFIIAFNHYKSEITIIQNQVSSEFEKVSIEKIQDIITNQSIFIHSFGITGPEQCNTTDQEFLDIIAKGKQNCMRGDVFQIVLSRQFSVGYKGDELELYRQLRNVNPSPYLFYFDYGQYKLIGSSPEMQLGIKKLQATVNPIAGTYKRTGNDVEDAKKALELFNDPKENAEHSMLVDLARNDLSTKCNEVKVAKTKEIQFYSHVIHLVSQVTGMLENENQRFDLIADTFPAGTLSGAPKVRAMQLINEYENTNRSYYGGAIGLLGFDGSCNHAIMIRTFLAQNATLYYQAGAGITHASVNESELQEVNNKVAALKRAISNADVRNR